MIHTLTTRQTVHASLEEVWAFFATPDNLNELTPPALEFRILSGAGTPLHTGQIIRYSIRLLPLVRVNWVTEIKAVEPLAAFIDEQRFGPYRFWQHRHQFIATADGVEIIDTVHYAVGYSLLGTLARKLWIAPQLAAIFEYRRQQIAARFAAG